MGRVKTQLHAGSILHQSHHQNLHAQILLTFVKELLMKYALLTILVSMQIVVNNCQKKNYNIINNFAGPIQLQRVC